MPRQGQLCGKYRDGNGDKSRAFPCYTPARSHHPLDRAHSVLCDKADAVSGYLCVKVTYLQVSTPELAQSFSIGSTTTRPSSQPGRTLRSPFPFHSDADTIHSSALSIQVELPLAVRPSPF